LLITVRLGVALQERYFPGGQRSWIQRGKLFNTTESRWQLVFDAGHTILHLAAKELLVDFPGEIIAYRLADPAVMAAQVLSPVSK
jgi:hypothetical protein